jgi:conserved repeat domain
LSLEKECSVERIEIGNKITYTLIVKNLGELDATGVKVEDILPAGVQYVSGSADNGGTHASGKVTWDGLNIAKGSSITLTFKGKATTTGVKKNKATLTYEKDNNAQNNKAECSTEVFEKITNLKITKTASKSSVKVGENFTYTIKVKNEGEIDAINTIVSDDLPAEVEYVSASPTPTTQIGNSLTWNLGTVAPSTTQTITVTVKAITAKDGVKNTATVTTDTEETTTDDNSDDELVDIKDVCPAPADICDTEEAFAIKVTDFKQENARRK